MSHDTEVIMTAPSVRPDLPAFGRAPASSPRVCFSGSDAPQLVSQTISSVHVHQDLCARDAAARVLQGDRASARSGSFAHLARRVGACVHSPAVALANPFPRLLGWQQSLLNAENGLVFAYGVTNSGKSFVTTQLE